MQLIRWLRVVLTSPAEGVCGQGRPQPSPQGWVYGVPQQEMSVPFAGKAALIPLLDPVRLYGLEDFFA